MLKLNIQMFAEDGKIIIGTEVDDSGVDKGIENIEKKLQIEDPMKEVNEAIKTADEQTKGLARDLQDMYDVYKEMTQGPVLFESDIQKSEELKQQIIQVINEIEKLTGEKIIIKGINDAKDDVKNFKKELDNIGKALESITKKVVKWGLSIFGIRSAYAGVRKLISIVGKENENIANQMKGLGRVLSDGLARLFAPVVQSIINLMAKLMMHVDYIYYRLTNKHLFDFSKVFSSAEKSSGGIAKNMNKITAGFDEMNVLQDNSFSSSGGGTESFDNPFEGWQNFKPPGWLKTIGDVIKGIANIVKKYWKGIVVALIVGGIAIMVTKFVKFIKSLKDAKTASEGLKGVSADFTGFFDSLGKGIEAIAILGGLALVIQSVSDMMTAFSESGLSVNDVLGLMGTIVGSLVVLITALTVASNALQSPLAMAGLLLLTASISAILLVIKETLPTILDALGDFIVRIGPTLNTILETIGQNIEGIIYSLGTALPPIIEKIGNVFDKIFNGIDKIIKTVGNTIVNIMNTAKNLITTVLDKILEFILKLGPAVNNLVDNIIKAVTKLINFMISGIEYMINTLIIGAIRGFINKINDIIPGEEFDLKAPSKIKIERFVPRLAKGGIINMPGRGVPVGSAIGGERGAEGVLPLTDSQQMALLGEAIGKYININATVPVYVGNRQIAREIRKINAEDDFAYNS